ncbi:MAG: hypothetical protein GW795_06130 [Cyanobacteria bacterium]|nr:hypothetical protein [Cyanobacteria bacterium CG_2015-16_32_12]NCO79451.1 hypothetical protein [Cyanobacteria bacterium CG_2015-22_32_23]NCQ03963.1 hypothetical protein [Cyanobacteria bacterium CG_2015-09_32_10]NCQ41464.1 hypothetical protein [Cyanobacteria bacterium CG_2015-04_32_10]NCS84292.1 hypothetical protein [Cyanobacteria bacterium CG_2015-02_32_10]
MISKTINLSEEKIKELLKEVLIELMETKKDDFHELFLEVIEEIGLKNAIQEGRKNDFVAEEDIFLLLENN